MINALFIAVSSAGVMALRALRNPQVHAFLVNTTSQENNTLQIIPRLLEDCQFVFLDLMGATPEFTQNLYILLQSFCGNLIFAHGDHQALQSKVRLGLLRSDKNSSRAEQAHRRAVLLRIGQQANKLSAGRLRDLRNEQWLCSYWKNGTQESIAQMLALLGSEYGLWESRPDFSEPIDNEQARLQWPEHDAHWNCWTDFAAMYPPAPEAPRVVLLYSPNRYPQDTHPVVGEFAQAFLKAGCHLTPLAAPRLQAENRERIQACLPPHVDVIVNLLSFRIGQGPMGGNAQVALDFLRKLDVPLLHPFFLSKRTQSQWEADPHGTSPAEFLLSIFLPEMDGAIESIPIATLDHNPEYPVLRLIPERVAKVVERTRRWSLLRQKRNSDKRIAILLYDYPPGAGHLGQAAFLDCTASLSALLAHLHSQGYQCPTPTATELREWITQLAHVVTSAPKPHPCAQASEAQWGEFPGEVYRSENGVALPGWLYGNVFLSLQPPRKNGVVSARDYHQEDLTPHHQYLAMYRYIAEDFSADALIHIGTHGTLEFTPGKENAPGASCFPDYLVGYLPHIYVYYSGNPSEAMIAKRRSHAVLVGHAQSPMRPGGLYGNLSQLETLLQEHAQSADLQPGRMVDIETDIRKIVQDLGWIYTDMESLHSQLDELRASLIPSRLHTLGLPYSADEANAFLDFFQQTHSEAKQQELDTIMQHLMTNTELHSIAHLLAGGYLPAGLAGDPYRNPEVLPSGRNLVQFDPRHIPSPTAERYGRALAESNLAAYRQENGNYPRNVALVLWGLETSKTQGESVAMILQYLGVRLVRASPWKMNLELITISELGRPRVDVQIQISGFLRDLFPGTIHLIDHAVELAANAQETYEENPIAERSSTTERSLLDSGFHYEDARDLARARIFGPKPGLYGTAVNALIKSAEWQQKEELADAYLYSMRHVYTRKRNGESQPQLLRNALHDVQMVSQVRGGQDYEVTDLDHYYEFLGGIRNSVVALGGAEPMMRVCDSLTGSLRSEDLAHSIQRGVRSRLLNPRWQDGMLQSEFHGAQQFAERMENLLGLSTLTDRVDNTLFVDVAQQLVLDPEMRQRLQNNNPGSARQIAEKLLEALQRNCWTAPEGMEQLLQDVLLEMEGDCE